MSCSSQSKICKLKLSKSIEKLFYDAQSTCSLKLSGRNLKEFPCEFFQYDLSDCVSIDLSDNRLSSIPEVILSSYFLEYLNLHGNVLKKISKSVINLHSLVYLNLSKNQLSTLADELCQLPIEILNISNNKLICLPETIDQMQMLQKLDVSCNEISYLPVQMKDLKRLKYLNLRKNKLNDFPVEITELDIVHLNLAENYITYLPIKLKDMSFLEVLNVKDNPLLSPPPSVCSRGQMHIFKFLEAKIKEDKNKINMDKNFFSQKAEFSNTNQIEFDQNKKRNTMDSGYGSIHKTFVKNYLNAQERPAHLDNHFFKSQSSPEASRESVLAPLNNFEDCNICTTIKDVKNNVPQNQSTLNSEICLYSQENVTARSTLLNYLNNSHNNEIATDKITSYPDSCKYSVQTYREYKEALKAQRRKENKKNLFNNANFEEKILIQTKFRVPSSEEWKNGVFHLPSDTLSNFALENSLEAEKSKNFTLQREIIKSKDENVMLTEMKEKIETCLKLTLPSNLHFALSDGVILCHLVNSICPRSVATIHVPSPSMPELNIAKRRRNIENFLEACRQLGIEEECLCSIEDIIADKMKEQDKLYNIINALLLTSLFSSKNIYFSLADLLRTIIFVSTCFFLYFVTSR